MISSVFDFLEGQMVWKKELSGPWSGTIAELLLNKVLGFSIQLHLESQKLFGLNG